MTSLWRVLGAVLAGWLIEHGERKQLLRSDEIRARNDPRHRARKVEAAIRGWWWKVGRWSVGQRAKRKGMTKARQELHNLTWTAKR